MIGTRRGPSAMLHHGQLATAESDWFVVSHAVLNSLVTDSSHKAFLAQTQRAAKGNSRAKGEGRLCEAV